MTSLKLQPIADLMNTCGVGFGTSGARGLVSQMNDRTCYAYTLAFIRHVQNNLHQDISAVAIAGDLRPSSPRIMQAVGKAVSDCGLTPVNCGHIPSPAVALYGLTHNMPAIMVTGSHIPDDRNGIKFNTADGEISKTDEQGIREQSVEIDETDFDSAGMLRQPALLPDENTLALAQYKQRFTGFFAADALAGTTVGVYQHSGVGRDLLVELLTALGAETLCLGRSATFVPVDTEAIREEDSRLAQQWAANHKLTAIVSTDGDADRPLISDENGNWLRGDTVGCLCAGFLGAKHVVTPVSSNTNVDKAGWFDSVVRTRIGSPFVIAGMQALAADNKTQVVGYEANGGFLQQDQIRLDHKTLSALPTRDAVIVILALLVDAKQRQLPVSALQQRLPARFTHSDRIKNIPTDKSSAMLQSFDSGNDAQDRKKIQEFLNLPAEIDSIDRTDGLRISLTDQNIVHLRPSGNAPELRCYAESATLQMAQQLNADCLRRVAEKTA